MSTKTQDGRSLENTTKDLSTKSRARKISKTSDKKEIVKTISLLRTDSGAGSTSNEKRKSRKISQISKPSKEFKGSKYKRTRDSQELKIEEDRKTQQQLHKLYAKLLKHLSKLIHKKDTDANDLEKNLEEIKETSHDLTEVDPTGVLIFEAVSLGRHDLLEVILSFSNKIELNPPGTGLSPVHEAVIHADLESLKLLSQYGVDLELSGGHERQTALHLAIKRKLLPVVSLLLEKGANPNQIDIYRCTPLHSAISIGLMDVAMELLGKGADINAIDHVGWTPLHLAVQKNHLDMVGMLLRRKAWVNSATRFGRTSMHVACQTDSDAMVRILHDHGANAAVRDQHGKLPVDYVGDVSLRRLLNSYAENESSKDRSLGLEWSVNGKTLRDSMLDLFERTGQESLSAESLYVQPGKKDGNASLSDESPDQMDANLSTVVEETSFAIGGSNSDREDENGNIKVDGEKDVERVHSHVDLAYLSQKQKLVGMYQMTAKAPSDRNLKKAVSSPEITLRIEPQTPDSKPAKDYKPYIKRIQRVTTNHVNTSEQKLKEIRSALKNGESSSDVALQLDKLTVQVSSFRECVEKMFYNVLTDGDVPEEELSQFTVKQNWQKYKPLLHSYKEVE